VSRRRTCSSGSSGAGGGGGGGGGGGIPPTRDTRNAKSRYTTGEKKREKNNTKINK